MVILLPCLHQYCGTTACLDLPSCLPAMCTTESRSRPPFPHAVAVLPPIPAAGESYLSLAPPRSRERPSYTLSMFSTGGVDISSSCFCWLKVVRRMWIPCVPSLILSCFSLLFSPGIINRMHFGQGILFFPLFLVECSS